ncbi:hypothetical protein DU002_00775 [Corallincola holothuriorum]|uniref:Uncharacterized protein n=1 Tax=Corallincola holothuriorum TaxID=2282215 RepID=A0A368NQW1_9GAMM|nr:hypothetical protein [Corallincola holothuriorum]RCU52536.1 hypothetical protein DU002_00775 [Corallincola holothuriorum]
MDNNEVINKLKTPEALEALYHSSPKQFAQQLAAALVVQPASETLQVWQARLSYQNAPKPTSTNDVHPIK